MRILRENFLVGMLVLKILLLPADRPSMSEQINVLALAFQLLDYIIDHTILFVAFYAQIYV